MKQKLLLIFLMACIGFFCVVLYSYWPPKQNAIKVRYNGRTETIYAAYAYEYSPGELIQLPTPEGDTFTAIVVEVIHIEGK